MPESERSSGAHVIGASALGTLFEWYDFFLYGALASSFASHFFSAVDETTAFIFALATFAVGFIVRPLGALVFGRIGDLVGRKVTFLATLAVMGLATFLVGVLPDYASIGIAAPLLLVALRILQGLAIGGEFGGAIVYVAEHAPPGRRGLHTSFIPAMAIGGLLLSLAVIAATRAAMTPAEFSAWGWRVPFLLSVILLGVSLWIRLRLQESPVFRRMQAERSLSRAPVSETFLQGRNLRLVLAALFGCVIGQAVLFYMGTFYAYYFLERVARSRRIHRDGADRHLARDRGAARGRKRLVQRPHRPQAPPARGRGARGLAVLSAVRVVARGRESRARAGARDGAGRRGRRSAGLLVALRSARPREQRQALLRRRDVLPCARRNQSRDADAAFRRTCAARDRQAWSLPCRSLARSRALDLAQAIADFQLEAKSALAAAGYRSEADPDLIDRPRVVALLVALLAFAAAASGAYAALLAEMFPARIRYTALSFPQNFGNGWFGGLLPAITFTIVAATGNVFAGLWYPVSVAALCLVVGWLSVPETRGRPIS